MKQLLFLLLFPCLALAQYQGNAGQKITLGEQTTADGLVYRGLAADTTRKPSVDTMAYIILDTTTNLIWHYKKGTSNAWLQAGGGVSVSSFSAGTTGLTPSTATTGAVTLGGTLAVANGGTNTSTAFTAGSVVFAGSSGTYTQDNSGLFYDNTNDRLGIGTADPRAKLQISGGVLNNSSLTDLGLSSALTNGRSGVFQTGSLASINTRGDATSVELIAGVSADYYSGISATAKNGSLFGGTLRLITAGLERMRISSTGNVGIGTESPTAVLHLKAGTATASTAPLKFTSGTNLTTAEAGAMEFNGTNLFFSPSTTRHTVNHGLTGSATLDFPSTTTLLSADLTITVTGAVDGDVVSLGVPNAAVNANTCYTAWVSAANTVTVRFNNYSSGTVDPASALFKVFVTK